MESLQQAKEVQNMMAKIRGLTPYQVKWARSHDWYLGDVRVPSEDGGCDRFSVMVADRQTTKDGERVLEIVWFDDYSKLRVWAGY